MRPAKPTGSGRGICALAHYRYQLAQAMSGRGGQGRCAHCGDRGGQSIIGRGTGVGKAIDTKFDPQLVSTGSKVSPFWTQPQPRCRPREDAGERCLPHNERIASKIIAIKFDQVEGIQERAVSMVPVPDEVERCDAVRAPMIYRPRCRRRGYYEKLVSLAGNADTARPDLVAAKQYLASK